MTQNQMAQAQLHQAFMAWLEAEFVADQHSYENETYNSAAHSSAAEYEAIRAEVSKARRMTFDYVPV